MSNNLPKSQLNNNLPKGQKGDVLPRDQDGTQITPVASVGTKETEKILAIKKELGKEAVEERAREVEPGVETIQEITVPEKAVELPKELKDLGIEAVEPPMVPEEFQPRAQTVTLSATQTQVKTGLAQPVVTSIRWWAALIVRLIEKTGGGFKYMLRGLGGKTD